MVRKIVSIDQELCNGCGACANACHEQAIVMIDGKANLIKDDFCDGFGDCLPACPTGAIKIEEREAVEYDKEAVERHIKINNFIKEMNTKQPGEETPAGGCPGSRAMTLKKPATQPGGGCPGSAAKTLKPAAGTSSPSALKAALNGGINNTANASAINASAIGANATATVNTADFEITYTPISQLQQWPVQIKLVSTKAPYFDGAHLLVAADCTAYAYANFHQKFIKNRITLIGCPKLDSIDYSEKLTEIIKNNNIKDVTVVRMQVPCCGGIEHAVVKALQNSGKFIPWQVYTVGMDGELISN